MALVFDFDQTLSNKDIYFYQVQPNDIKPISDILDIYILDTTNYVIKIYNDYYGLSTIFNDYLALVDLFNNLKSQNYKLCITSFGKLNVINKIISIAFPNTFDLIITTDNYIELARENYITDIPPSRNHFIIDNSCKYKKGKNIMYQTIINFFNLPADKLIVFDDNKDIVNCGINILGVNGFNNPKSGVTDKMILDTINKYFNNNSLQGGNYYIKYKKYKSKYLSLKKR